MLEWAQTEGSDARSIAELLDSYCRFLNRSGLDIRRCSLGTETVHPLLTNTRHAWFDRVSDPGHINPGAIVTRREHRFGPAMIDEVLFATRGSNNEALAASPFQLLDGQSEFHSPIPSSSASQHFPVFDDLSRLDCTGYYCTKLKSFAGKTERIGIATGRAGGFDEVSLTILRQSLGVLTLLLNTIVENNLKETLARVYVGQDPGARVCAGMIRPGEVVSIEAAIWFSDIRGFTASGETLAPEAMVERLNAYFEVIAGAIYEAGGEVLKYIGDAVLAIFPVAQAGGRSEACAAALVALKQTERVLAGLNKRFADRGEAAISHGVGLHLGEASYGNIGGRERLDFTVIGRAVNLASRIESICKDVGAVALCSSEFASMAPPGLPALGEFDLKGIAEPMTLHRVQ